MDQINLSSLLDPQLIEKKIKKVVENTQKVTTALVNLGVDSLRVPLNKAANSMKSDTCPECVDMRTHSDVKNYVCPPPDICSPRCLASLELRARPGENRVVSFGIRNTSNVEKTYQVGVRPFVDSQGNPLEIRVFLSETLVKIPQGKTIFLDLWVSVPVELSAGAMFETDIVVREAKNNQNICLTLVVEGRNFIPVASPLDEKYLNIKFHRWHHHYYSSTPEELQVDWHDHDVITPIDPKR